jgi:hypothetical protein
MGEGIDVFSAMHILIIRMRKELDKTYVYLSVICMLYTS